MQQEMIEIFLADDHAIVREGLKRLIDAEPDMRVIGEACEGGEALDHILRLRPHVVVLDVSMPGLNGLAVAQRLRTDCPDAKVLVLTVHEDNSYSREMLEAGALGYMLKRAAADELVPAIRTVAAGGMHVDAGVTEQLMGSLLNVGDTPLGPPERLSEREEAVLRMIAQGYSNKEIAAHLELSVKTIETYKGRSMEKLRLRSRVDIVRHAHRHGWLRDA